MKNQSWSKEYFIKRWRYLKFIESCKSRNGCPKSIGDTKPNFEIHHIIAKVCNGTDDPKNLVYLTEMEHKIAHELLNKMSAKHQYYWDKNSKNWDVERQKINKRYKNKSNK